jgi:FtsH-binding integral membrane protein
MISLVLSVAALTLLVALALAGLFYRNYEENWLQFFGLWGVAFGGCAKVAQILERDYSSAENTMLYCALAAFAVGTFVKVRKYRNAGDRGQPNSTP